MKMTTKSNKHRTGIYVQESADVTTAGDGLGPRGNRSPVAPYDNTLIRSQIDDAQNPEKNTSYKTSSFEASRTKLRSVIEGGCESDTNDVKPHRNNTFRNNTFRIQRNKQMKDEFSKLGFSCGEIHAMQVGLEIERRQRHIQNKMLRYCDEANLDLKSAMQTCLERKERETAKYRAEKAAKIAAGTFNPIPFRERKGKRDRDKDRERGRDTNRDTEQDKDRAGERSCHGTINHFNSTEFFMPESLDQYEAFKNKKGDEPVEKKQIFTSPAILAGAKEDDSPYSCEFRRKAAKLMKEMGLVRIKDFEEARRRMGLSGRHIKNIYHDPSTRFQDSPYSPETEDDKKLERKSFYALKAQYPVEVQISDKSHPMGVILQENHFILLDALETTIQDERVLGAHWIQIGPAQYKKMRLYVNCMNNATVTFLQNKVPLYNRLWRGANLFVTKEKVIYKRYKYRFNLKRYNLTSEEFFKIIKKQNGYHTEYWIFCHRFMGAKDANNFRGWFAVDVESHRRLQESEGFVHFLFERIQFSLFEPNDANADSD